MSNELNITGRQNGRLTFGAGQYLLCLLGLITVAMLVHLRVNGIFACTADGYLDNRFLAVCMGDAYGEYDHAAFWFDLEPEARDSLVNAEVLILGNSRMQAGFSTPAVERWFRQVDIPYYMLGLSWRGNMQFIGPVLDNFNPTARVYVINADEFFHTWESPVAREVMNNPHALQRYVAKRRWQNVHQLICGSLPALCGQKTAFFRSRDNGSWLKAGEAPDLDVETYIGKPTEREQWPEFIELGESFLAQLPVSRECVLLTVVPYPDTKLARAQEIARSLMLNLYVPDVQNLTTFDGSHLDIESRERWAAEFFAAAGPQIDRCLQTTQKARV